MKMKHGFTKLLGLSMLLTAATVGCNRTGPGNEEAYQKDSSNCGYKFISDYNTVQMRLKMVKLVSELDAAQSLVNDFKNKYSGVVCKAVIT
jgi:hypothetical protein